MNCANHPDRERTAFCQNCGKPLCNECIRSKGLSVYCEPCFAARENATAPSAGYGYPAAGYPPPGRATGQPIPPPVPGEPHPGLAALLGLIPGVGAMYNEQYGKGLVHLLVFAVLVSLSHDVGIFHLFVFGWIIYMVAEAYHTARARRDGTPLPNPFGLNDVSERLGFGRTWPGATPPYPGAGPSPYEATPRSYTAADPAASPATAANPNVPPANPAAPPYSYTYTYTPPVAQWGPYSYGVPPVPPIPPMPPYPDPNLPYQRSMPTGAIWLIGLGVLFLLGNTGAFHLFPGRLFGPLLVIGVGVWVFVHKMVSTGEGMENDGTPLYRWRLGRAINGAIWIVLIGVIWLLDALRILRWSSSWPLLLIAGGILLILKRTMTEYGGGYPPYPGAMAVPPAAPAADSNAGPVDAAHGDATHGDAGNGQEGR